MVSHQPIRPTFIQQLALLKGRIHLILKLLTLIPLRRLRGTDPNQPLLKTIAISFLLAARLAIPRELTRRNLRPSTGTIIQSYCRRASPSPIPHESVPLLADHSELSCTLHFLGPSSSSGKGKDKARTKKVLYYLHGGGYVQPITGPGHLSFAVECAKALSRSTSTSKNNDADADADAWHDDVQLCILEYTLAPECAYPGQLIQAIHGLIYLLEHHVVVDHRADRIILGGDSAGGNLALGLLAHVKRPSPYAPVVDLGGQKRKLAGVYLISPWVGMEFKTESYERNEGVDFLTRRPQMEGVVEMWGGRRGKGEVWADMLTTPPQEVDDEGDGFWKGVVGGRGKEGVVESMLIVVGMKEIFCDDILEFGRRVGAEEGEEGEGGGRGNVKLVKCDGEVHTSCLLDSAMGIKGGGMGTAVLRWLRELGGGQEEGEEQDKVS
ncbi:MAG: hypothetical protein Q9227_005972 [Pyrenula ochraceoflavens]